MSAVTELRFRYDWSPVDDSVRATELRATWARLEIWVGDRCATLAEDEATGSTRKSIVVSLYPVAEWIAYNWWLLRFDGRDDESTSRVGRRDLRSAGDGFVWPSIEITPRGPVSLVTWSPAPTSPGQGLQYLSSGQRWIDTLQLQSMLTDLVQTVVTRLEESGIRETPLQKEWADLAALDREEVEFCEAAARLGLDPFTEGIDLAQSIDQVFTAFESTVREDFLDAVHPAHIEPALTWVNASLAESRRERSPQDSPVTAGLLMGARHATGWAASGTPPWTEGYTVARDLRDRLGMEPTQLLDGLPVKPVVRQGGVREVTGVGNGVDDGKLINLVLIRRMHEQAERFAMSRALWHATRGDDEDGFLLTGAHSISQRIGRAFAAELLAPAAGIRELLDVAPRAATPEDITVVADHFQTSDMVVAHQIENQLAPS